MVTGWRTDCGTIRATPGNKWLVGKQLYVLLVIGKVYAAGDSWNRLICPSVGFPLDSGGQPSHTGGPGPLPGPLHSSIPPAKGRLESGDLPTWNLPAPG